MDSTTFDSVARFFGNRMTRRKAVRGLLMGASALAAGSLARQTPEAEARRRRRRGKKHNKPSHDDSQRCGRQGDGCGALDENNEYTAPYCCHGYECVYHPDGGAWTCEVVV